MKRLIFTCFLLIATLFNMDATSNVKEDLKQIRNDIVSYTGVKKAPVKYVKDLDIYIVEIECPKIWNGEPEYVANNLSTVMSRYANVSLISQWCYDNESIYAEYHLNIDNNVYYDIVINYYRMSNVMVITMYDPYTY